MTYEDKPDEQNPDAPMTHEGEPDPSDPAQPSCPRLTHVAVDDFYDPRLCICIVVTICNSPATCLMNSEATNPGQASCQGGEYALTTLRRS
jgi:hypothetical protein